MKRFLRILLLSLLLGVLLLAGFALYLWSSSGQAFLTRQVTTYLNNKLKTRVSIQAIHYQIPDWISMEGVYFEDMAHDTLLAGSKLRVDLDMAKLLHNQVAINKMEVENVRLNIKRTSHDGVFNYDFIVKAFTSPEPQQPNSSPLGISLNKILAKNLHVTFKDDFTGNDVTVFIKNAETAFDAFDPNKSEYHIATLEVDGISTHFRQYLAHPKLQITQVETPKNAADTLDVSLKKIQISSLDWQVNLEEAGIENHGKIQDFNAEINKVYLNSQFVQLKKLSLNVGDIALNLQKVSPKNTIPAKTTNEKTWTVLADNIQSSKLNLRFDDTAKPIQKQGLDYGHIFAKNINFELVKLNFANSNISGNLKSASMSEKSGLVLQSFRTDFLYSDKETSLKNLYLKTPKTLLRDELVLQYKSIEQFSKDLGNVSLKAKLIKSQISTNEILLLAPNLAKMPIFKQNPNDILKFDGVLAGKINKLAIQKIDFTGFGATHFAASGRILGLPEINKMVFDVNVSDFSANKKDLLKALPDSLIPKNIELPEHLKLAGTAKGKLSGLELNTSLITDFGNAAFNGTLTNISAKTNQTYDGKLTLDAFDVGKLMKRQDQVGKVTLNANLKGSGFDPKTAQASINGTMQQAFLKGYEYKNLTLSGNLANQMADLQANLQDENAKIKLSSHINFAEKSPAVQSEMQVEKLDLKKLHLYADSLSLKGIIDVDLTSIDATNPLGNINIKNVVLNNGNTTPIKLSDANVVFQNNAEGKLLTLKTPFMEAKMAGNFEYADLKNIFLTEINKYFSLPDTFTQIKKSYNFAAEGFVKNDPIIQAFLPKLMKLDSTQFSAKLNNQQDTTLRFMAFVPYVRYDSTEVTHTKLTGSADGKKLRYNFETDHINQLGKTVLRGNVADNLITFRVSLKDSVLQNQYSLNGNLTSINNNFRLNFGKNVTLNYQKWRVDSTGFMQFGNSGILINNFTIQHGNQKLHANSTTNVPNSPIKISAENVTFPALLRLVQQDTLLASGVLNGDFVVSNLDKKPLYTGEASIKDFAFTQIPIGDLDIKSYNETSSKIIAEATLKGSQNDMVLLGSFDANSKNPLDFDLLINKLSGATIQAFSFGQLQQTKGSLTGKLKVKGTTLSPKFDGNVQFDSVSFKVSKLGSIYKINNQKLLFKGQEMLLKKFIISDTTGQKLVVNGNINLAKITAVAYDLNVQTNDFMALNSLAKENDFFYGKGYFDTNLNIKGVMANAVVDGTVKLKNPSQITVIMPNDAAEKENTEGVVMFVNKSGEEIVAADTTSNKVNAFTTEVALNVESDEASEMIIVIDPLNGDNIKVHGKAQLTAGRTASGQNYIFGSYDITSGTYDLTYQLIKKGFTIQKGSNIVWTGDPMQGNMNITAIYDVEAAPYDLIAADNPSNPEEYKKKMPFKVYLNMNGNISNPQVSFNLKLDSEKQIIASSEVLDKVNAKLKDLKGADTLSNINTNADLNKQVFGLLLTKNFIPDQPSDFFSNLNAEAIARQSVSKLLSDQLNQLARNLIKGVRLDLNLNSTTANSVGQTDLLVGLSKGFLNNRLTVTVGRNFELENSSNSGRNPTEVFDNVSLNYNLSDDGRYLFRAYRKNEFEAVLDGFVVKTGLSFRVTMEFEKLKEILKKN